MNKVYYAVVVYDRTCNVAGHDFGAYGKEDYSWISDSLNGGMGAKLMTKEEADEVKADFDRVIRERSLDWAAVMVEDWYTIEDDQDHGSLHD